MKTKLNWKKFAVAGPMALAASAFLTLTGCSNEPASNYHNHKFVLSDVKRAESNNFPPAPSKPDDFLTYYGGYSEDKSRNTRVGQGEVGTSSGVFTATPNGSQNYYGGNQGWGNYSGWGGGYGGYGNGVYGGYGYGYGGYRGW